jgi:hypothetical protein
LEAHHRPVSVAAAKKPDNAPGSEYRLFENPFQATGIFFRINPGNPVM